MSATTMASDTASSACGVCGAKLRDDVMRPASTYSAPGTYRIAACDACGCGQTQPRPDEAELEAFYARSYKYDAHVLIASEKRWRARRILDIAGVDARKAPRVLDVGCMYGYLVEEAKARGASEAVGVELSSGPAADAKSRGLDVFCGTIEDFAVERSQAFDLIVAQHVLEHVTDLASFLETAHRLIAPGGKLCICVPNFDARARRVFREAWGWYQVPVHLHHFGLASLAKLLDAHGFEVDRHERRGGDSLFVLLTLLQSMGRAPSSDAVEPGVIGKSIVRAASAILRPYYFVGDDELVVVARAKASPTRTR
jgi:SAM-dependent methyltransferase